MKIGEKRRAASTAQDSLRRTSFYQKPRDVTSPKLELTFLAIRMLDVQPEDLRIYRLNQAARVLRRIPPKERDRALSYAFRHSLYPEDYNSPFKSYVQECNNDYSKL